MLYQLVVLLLLPALGYANEINSRAYCEEKYGSRDILDYSLMRVPPLLLTVPGAGTTWVGLLVDYASGIYSGSVMVERDELTKILPGLVKCGQRVSILKSHTNIVTASIEEDKLSIKLTQKSDRNKCRPGTIYDFNRVVALIRDPYASIWSDYQRMAVVLANSNNSMSHAKGIPMNRFKENEWKKLAVVFANRYADAFKGVYKTIAAARPEERIFEYYEDLLNPELRLGVLRRIVEFTEIKSLDLSDERLQCAFTLADNPLSHRNTSTLVQVKIKEESVTVPQVSIKEAYASQDLVCKMHSVFSGIVFPQFHDRYKPYGGISCDSFVSADTPAASPPTGPAVQSTLAVESQSPSTPVIAGESSVGGGGGGKNDIDRLRAEVAALRTRLEALERNQDSSHA